MASKKETYFEESEHNFTFSTDWEILKYDSHPFYKIVSGRSFSGVDFAGFHKDKLYLIEIKNFYQYGKTGDIENVDEFCEEMKEKFLDTLDLIRIIQKYFQRKWSYRLFCRLVMSYPNLNKTWWFWTMMADRVENDAFVFVLLIDSIEKESELQTTIEQLVAKEFQQKVHVVSSSIKTGSVEGLTVLDNKTFS